MKIDIGPDGKILGTKRVSPNGQVSGFTEFAGQDVLVILPGGRAPVVKKDAADLLAEAEALVRQRMELAFEEYRHLRQKYPTPDVAAKAFVKTMRPKSFQGLIAKADAWIRDQRASSANGEADGSSAKAAKRRKT